MDVFSSLFCHTSWPFSENEKGFCLLQHEYAGQLRDVTHQEAMHVFHGASQSSENSLNDALKRATVVFILCLGMQ